MTSQPQGELRGLIPCLCAADDYEGRPTGRVHAKDCPAVWRGGVSAFLAVKMAEARLEAAQTMCSHYDALEDEKAYDYIEGLIAALAAAKER